MNKLKYYILSLLLVGSLIGAGIAVYCNWNAITGTINNSKYYTSEDLQNSYDKGYRDGINNEFELSNRLEYLNKVIDENYMTISNLQEKNNELIISNNNMQMTITSLENERVNLENNIFNLENINRDNENRINSLYEEINYLNSVKVELENLAKNNQADIENLNFQINSLNAQINSYQNTINQLESSNRANVETINSLNSQVQSLNNQIVSLNYELEKNSGLVSSLTKQLNELKASISHYEAYIASLENDNQVIVTFEYDGSIYSIQTVEKNSKTVIKNPDSNNKVIFNGWTVNGTMVNLDEFICSSNTRFVADVTYKNEVNFVMDNEVINTQFIKENESVNFPELIEKEGYVFEGWTLNGIDIIDTQNYFVSCDTTFIAKFSRVHKASFVYGDEVISTQIVKSGDAAEAVYVEDSEYARFYGWKVNGEFVDIVSYNIYADTVFVAEVMYSYDVNFFVDDFAYESQIVSQNKTAILPQKPYKNGYKFIGWSINNEIIIDLDNYLINSNINFYAVFNEIIAGAINEDGSTYLTWNEVIDNNYFSVSEDGGLYQTGTTSNIINLFKNRTLVIPDSVSYLASDSLLYYYYLKGLQLPATINHIDENALYDITNRNLGISSNSGHDYFKEISIEDNEFYEVIDGNLIEKQTNKLIVGLDPTNIPSNISSIGTYAFYGSLKSGEIIIPNSVTDIGNHAFNGCVNVTKITIGTGVKNIGHAAFANCSAVKEIRYNAISCNSVKSTSYPFLFSGKNGYTVYIGKECTKVPSYLFANSSDYKGYLKNVIFNGNACTFIGNNSFDYCKALTSFRIPSSVTSIGSNAFRGCEKLTSIYIPESVIKITASSASSGIFKDCSSSLKVYVGASSKSSDYGKYWDYYTTSKQLDTHYGYSYREYLSETGAIA